MLLQPSASSATSPSAQVAPLLATTAVSDAAQQPGAQTTAGAATAGAQVVAGAQPATGAQEGVLCSLKLGRMVSCGSTGAVCEALSMQQGRFDCGPSCNIHLCEVVSDNNDCSCHQPCCIKVESFGSKLVKQSRTVLVSALTGERTFLSSAQPTQSQVWMVGRTPPQASWCGRGC